MVYTGYTALKGYFRSKTLHALYHNSTSLELVQLLSKHLLFCLIEGQGIPDLIKNDNSERQPRQILHPGQGCSQAALATANAATFQYKNQHIF